MTHVRALYFLRWVTRSGLTSDEFSEFHRYTYSFTNALGQMLALSIGLLTPQVRNGT